MDSYDQMVKNIHFGDNFTKRFLRDISGKRALNLNGIDAVKHVSSELQIYNKKSLHWLCFYQVEHAHLTE